MNVRVSEAMEVVMFCLENQQLLGDSRRLDMLTLGHPKISWMIFAICVYESINELGGPSPERAVHLRD